MRGARWGGGSTLLEADACIVISGCSGGGKSTLLKELARRGFPVVEEPGRRVAQQQMAMGGTALPWVDMRGFLERVFALAKIDRQTCDRAPTFFDRGLVDAAVGLERLTLSSAAVALAGLPRYCRHVFLTPPWPDIYVTDDERRHDFAEAASEYDLLLRQYPRLGYEVSILPETSVADRADMVLARLAQI